MSYFARCAFSRCGPGVVSFSRFEISFLRFTAEIHSPRLTRRGFSPAGSLGQRQTNSRFPCQIPSALRPRLIVQGDDCLFGDTAADQVSVMTRVTKTEGPRLNLKEGRREVRRVTIWENSSTGSNAPKLSPTVGPREKVSCDL